MRGITRTIAVAGVGVLATAAPMISTAGLPAAFGSDYHRVQGTMGDDRLHGTPRADLLAGRSGDDTIRPHRGTDIVRAAGGNDRIFLFNDGDVDRIHCGDGFDVVYYHFSIDPRDIIDANCEGRVA